MDLHGVGLLINFVQPMASWMTISDLHGLTWLHTRTAGGLRGWVTKPLCSGGGCLTRGGLTRWVTIGSTRARTPTSGGRTDG